MACRALKHIVGFAVLVSGGSGFVEVALGAGVCPQASFAPTTSAVLSDLPLRTSEVAAPIRIVSPGFAAAHPTILHTGWPLYMLEPD